MKKIVFYFFALALWVPVMVSCGPSADDRRQQEIQDSLKLEEDRRKLLERANTLFATPSDTTKVMADEEKQPQD